MSTPRDPVPPLDWPALLRAGLGGLRLRPDQFWALTPRELSLMLGLEGRPPPMTRARLWALIEEHPDAMPDTMEDAA